MNEQSATDRLGARILWGLVIGLIAGLGVRALGVYFPAVLGGADWLADAVLDPFGQVFLRMLFFVVVPLVFASLALGVAQLGRLDRLGPLAGKTFALFFLNMGVAVALGLIVMNVLRPGAAIEAAERDQMLSAFGGTAETLKERAAAQPSLSFGSLVEMLMPRNLAGSVADFQVLPLIVFALLVGAAATQLGEGRRLRVIDALEAVVQLMTHIVHFALRLAPYAVPALIFGVVVRTGIEFLQALALFVAGVLCVMLVQLFGTLSLVVRFLGRRSPREFFRAVKTVMVTAFSTSSSNATLPTSIQVAREKLGVSETTSGFVLPLGATMNMSGTALYEGCVVLFIAQVYGVGLGFGQQALLLVLAVLSSVAVAGIPGGSLPLIVGLLVNFGIPAEGIALILGTDRVLDMARTVVNVSADLATAVVVDNISGGEPAPSVAMEDSVCSRSDVRS